MGAIKGTPSTYNKDFQEDKELLFDSVDNMLGTQAKWVEGPDGKCSETARLLDE